MEHIKLGQHDAGIMEFETVLQKDPSYVATYYQLGKIYERELRLPEAVETYKKGIQVASEAEDGHTRDELTEALTLLENTL
jgi:tetratricopeptide (TPR) repeat protein